MQGGFNPFDSKDDRLLLMKMIIKCADVSNPTKEMAIYEKWIHAILEEWRFQGDQERRLGMKVARTNEPDNDKLIASSQLFFINNLVSPIFEALHFGFLPTTPAYENLQVNRDRWMAEEERKKSAAAVPASQP